MSSSSISTPSPKKFNRVPYLQGSLTITAKKPSTSELRAANYLKSRGCSVILRDPKGKRSVDGDTSDLVDNRTGRTIDVYTPETSNPSRIIEGIYKKNNQAREIVLDLSKTKLTKADLGDIMGRLRGKVRSSKTTKTLNIERVHVIK